MATFGDLEASGDFEERFAEDGKFVAMEGLARDEEIGDAEFVFEGNEAMAFGGAGALSADDEAGHEDGEAVGEAGEVGGGEPFFTTFGWGIGRGKGFPPEFEGVGSGGAADEGEVGFEAFARGHHGEDLVFIEGVGLGGESASEGEEVVVLRFFNLPEGIAAVVDLWEVVEGAGGGEEAAFFLIEWDAFPEVVEGGKLGV